ncbi:hypothetical protein BaRGS_00019463 [Batillaria attramentaria]|uniref:Uncharacterized protein n=1 Tax=Batillaria attramentaria TaxID=370345 RepID=A0ABD0KRI7_9CAEN
MHITDKTAHSEAIQACDCVLMCARTTDTRDSLSQLLLRLQALLQEQQKLGVARGLVTQSVCLYENQSRHQMGTRHNFGRRARLHRVPE